MQAQRQRIWSASTAGGNLARRDHRAHHPDMMYARGEDERHRGPFTPDVTLHPPCPLGQARYSLQDPGTWTVAAQQALGVRRSVDVVSLGDDRPPQFARGCQAIKCQSARGSALARPGGGGGTTTEQ